MSIEFKIEDKNSPSQFLKMIKDIKKESYQLLEEIEEKISKLPDTGDKCETSQKICIMNALYEVEKNLNGLDMSNVLPEDFDELVSFIIENDIDSLPEDIFYETLSVRNSYGDTIAHELVSNGYFFKEEKILNLKNYNGETVRDIYKLYQEDDNEVKIGC